MGVPFVDPIQQLITQEVFGCLKKHCLILFHFKKNFINLEGKKNELEKQRGKVHEQVEKAGDQGDVIIKEVSEWIEDIEKSKKEVDDLMQEKIERESITCFRFSFPNYVSRYRLSKRAEEKITDAEEKISDGNFATVSVPAPPPPELQLPPTIGEYKVFESRQAVLNKIRDALKENNVVGIHGAGGVGKTTMAAEVAKQLQTEGYFHEIAMAVVSKDPDVKRIQGKLARSLKDFRLDDKENEEERARRLWNRLKNGKSNLVILDDLWGKINLKEIGIPAWGGNKDCKLLITSRQPQEVWKHNTWDSKLLVRLIAIEQLKDKEAWELFKNHAGDSIESSELHSIASKVCKKCGGLPVAIRAVGEALKDKDLYEWNDALKNLEKSRMERIVGIDEKFFPSLKLSYKMLKSEEARKCFLLCCLFPDDSEIPIEDLVLHCKAAIFVEEDTMVDTRNRVQALVNHLKDRCLLQDVASEENCVKVHDVIRDVGISISKEGNELLQLMHGFQDTIRGGGEGASSSSEGKNKRRPYIAMSLRKSHFKDDLLCPDVGTLVLQWKDSSVEHDYAFGHELQLHANKFISCTNLSLKVFVLYGLNILSVFPSSGGQSFANLRMLCLDTWWGDDKNVLRHLGKLKVFCLRTRNVLKLPSEIGLLKELLVLDLKELDGLQKIPKGVLSKLTKLEELHLPLEFTQWENESGTRNENASISELRCLKQLTTLRASFPNRDLPWANDIFGKLNRFDISVGLRFSSFSRASTKVLKVRGVSTTNKFKGLISQAEELDFKWVDGLRGPIHGTGHGLPYLRKLEITDCNALNYLFSERSGRALRQLRVLEVWSCKSLVSIVGGTEVEVLEKDQEDITCFERLERVNLQELPNLVGFCSRVKNGTGDGAVAVLFSGKVACPALENLTIEELPNIESIWDERSYKSFQNLRELSITSCEKIESIVLDQGKEDLELGPTVLFPALRLLWIKDLINVKRLYTKRSLPKEESFFNHQVALPALEDLTIEKLPEIENIWDERSYKNFQNLKELSVASCKKIESIVSNQGKEHLELGPIILFPALKSVWLGDLINVKRFYTIRSIPNKESFSYHQVVYPALDSFCFSGIPKATEVFKSKILPQLIDQVTKEICEQGNDFQGVSLPSLKDIELRDENIEMPEPISITPAEHGISVEINWKEFKGCDMKLLQPLFDAFLGFGCE